MHSVTICELEMDVAMLRLELAQEQLQAAEGLRDTWIGFKAVVRASANVYACLFRYLRAVAASS